MITNILLQLFAGNLNQLTEEISQYPTEEGIWTINNGIKNSGGNLCLHITGNLLYFIGSVLGETGYVRNRNAEFSLKNIPRIKLLERIEDTKTVVNDTLEQLSKKELESIYPQQVLEGAVSTEFFLIYLLNHLSYHLGQLNYHRRMIDVSVRVNEPS